MKSTFSQEWCLKMALLEEETDVGAGALSALPSLSTSITDANDVPADVIDLRVAFSQLVSMLRRRKGYTIDRLAREAKIEVAELVAIERTENYRPSARTVYQLSAVFGVPNKSMLRLAGIRQEKDASLAEAAVRFAASSEAIEKLTKEEAAALDAFVAALSDRSER